MWLKLGEYLRTTNPFLRIILLIEVMLLGYLSPLQVKIIVLAIAVFLVYALSDNTTRKSVVVFTVLMTIGYITVMFLGRQNPLTYIPGYITLLTITLTLVLIVLVLDLGDLDYIAWKLRLRGRYFLAFRTSLAVLDMLLRDVGEAFDSTKAKHRGKLIGFSALKYTVKALTSSFIVVNQRVTEVAETIYMYPPTPITRNYRSDTLTVLDIILAILVVLCLV